MFETKFTKIADKKMKIDYINYLKLDLKEKKQN